MKKWDANRQWNIFSHLDKLFSDSINLMIFFGHVEKHELLPIFIELPHLQHRNPNSSAPLTGGNLQAQAQPQLYQILALIFILILSSIIFWVKSWFKLLKGSNFEVQNCNIHQKKGHSNLHI